MHVKLFNWSNGIMIIWLVYMYLIAFITHDWKSDMIGMWLNEKKKIFFCSNYHVKILIWAISWQNCVVVHTVKTQIRLGIRAQWVAKDPSFLHADSELWSDWADAQVDLSLRWANNHIVDFVMRRLIFRLWSFPQMTAMVRAACKAKLCLGCLIRYYRPSYRD